MVNSLSNYEVSIIKNLLGKPDFKNQEIAGLINRSRGDAKSDVSPGRTKSGTHKASCQDRPGPGN